MNISPETSRNLFWRAEQIVEHLIQDEEIIKKGIEDGSINKQDLAYTIFYELEDSKMEELMLKEEKKEEIYDAVKAKMDGCYGDCEYCSEFFDGVSMTLNALKEVLELEGEE